MRLKVARTTMCLIWALLVPTMVWAQGAIGGVVRDTSGAVLPGVTIEASSPALIEKARTAVTDDRGQYLIVDLRPGTYRVAFSLSGFRTLSREGLVLSAGVTLPINAQLEVGGVEETLTVTGETPVVDVSNTRQQTVMTRELLDAVPRARNAYLTSMLLPGVNNAASGAAVDGTGTLGLHGGRSGDQTTSVDGMWLTDFSGPGGQNELMPSDAGVQEYTYETSAVSAETMSGGLHINIVPKEGGNVITGSFFANIASEGLTANNLSDALKAKGLTSAQAIDKIWEVNPALGGPLLANRLWFFGTYKNWGAYTFPPGAISEAKPTERARSESTYWSAGLRLTWQASLRNKVTAYYEQDTRDMPYQGLSATSTAEGSIYSHYPELWLAQTKWTAPVTNRLLLEAGVNRHRNEIDYDATPVSKPGAYPTLEITTGLMSGANQQRQRNPNQLWLVSAAASYVTGSHAFKAGVQHLTGHRYRHFLEVPPLLRMQNGVPFQVRFEAIPAVTRPHVNHDLGVYVQDKWVLQRMTLNLGLRFDYLNSQMNAQDAPPNPFFPELLGARHFEPIYNVPNWKDLNPRVGIAYDLFGDARTAIKASVSRYVVFEAINFAQSVNPMVQGGTGANGTAGASDTRTWNDRNGDRIPQPDELGPSTNLNFGKPIIDIRPDPEIAEGWGVRTYNWEYNAGVQRQVVPGLSASVSYIRRAYGNLLWNNNTLQQQTDYTPFTIANPLDGTPLTLYDLNPAKRGLSDTVRTFAPDNTEVYNGVETVVNGRFAQGGIVNGSMTIGRTATSTCTVNDPNQLRFCDVTPPFMAQAIYKALVAYQLPYGIQASGVYQGLPGQQIAANYTVTSAIAGRTLTNGSIAVNLVEPGSLYDERMHEVDLRFSKRIQVNRVRVEPSMDVFNAFNASPVRGVNNTYGPLWRRATSTLVGRMLKFAVKVDF